MDPNLEKVLPYTLDQLEDNEKAEFEDDLNENPDLEQEVMDMQLLLEAIALAETPVKPSAKLKSALLSSLNSNTRFHGFTERFMALFDLDQQAVESLFERVINSSVNPFKPCGIPKTSLFYFDGGPKVSQAECGIIKVIAGSIFPAHKHQGKEWVFVLQGTAIDRSGQRYSPGDTVFSDENVSHSLMVNQEEDLIFAVILEKPNKWLLGQIIMDYLFSRWRFEK